MHSTINLTPKLLIYGTHHWFKEEPELIERWRWWIDELIYALLMQPLILLHNTSNHYMHRELILSSRTSSFFSHEFFPVSLLSFQAQNSGFRSERKMMEKWEFFSTLALNNNFPMYHFCLWLELLFTNQVTPWLISELGIKLDLSFNQYHN